MIHHWELPKFFKTLLFRPKRKSSFEASDIFIPGNTDGEVISKSTRLSEKRKMTRMEEIEGPTGEHFDFHRKLI